MGFFDRQFTMTLICLVAIVGTLALTICSQPNSAEPPFDRIDGDRVRAPRQIQPNSIGVARSKIEEESNEAWTAAFPPSIDVVEQLLHAEQRVLDESVKLEAQRLLDDQAFTPRFERVANGSF